MFSIKSLDGNSFFDIALKFQKMAIEELGDESFTAPLKLGDIEKSSLASTGDNSFSKFVSSFDKLYSLVTAYVYKRDSNTFGNEKEIDELSDKITEINKNKATKKIRDFNKEDEEGFTKYADTLNNALDEIETPISKQDVQTVINPYLEDITEDGDDIVNTILLDYIFNAVNDFTETKKLGRTLNMYVKSLKDMRDESFLKVVESVKDEKDQVLIDAQQKIDMFKEQSLASGNIGELNSLNDASLLSSELYDVLSKNISTWDALIVNKDIILKKGDTQKYKIKEDSSEMLQLLSKDKYAKEDQKVYKVVLKNVKLLDVLIQQLGSADGSAENFNKISQFIGNTSYPTRNTPVTGVNTNPVIDPLLQDEITDAEHENSMKILTQFYDDSFLRTIVAVTPKEVLETIQFKPNKPNNTTKKKLVKLLIEYYNERPSEAFYMTEDIINPPPAYDDEE